MIRTLAGSCRRTGLGTRMTSTSTLMSAMIRWIMLILLENIPMRWGISTREPRSSRVISTAGASGCNCRGARWDGCNYRLCCRGGETAAGAGLIAGAQRAVQIWSGIEKLFGHTDTEVPEQPAPSGEAVSAPPEALNLTPGARGNIDPTKLSTNKQVLEQGRLNTQKDLMRNGQRSRYRWIRRDTSSKETIVRGRRPIWVRMWKRM